MELNFAEPGCMSSVWCRLVMVKLRVKGTSTGAAAAAGGRKKEAMPESDLGQTLRQLLGVEGKRRA